MSKTLAFAYVNHRGESEARVIDVVSLDFIRKPGFGYQPGWFLTGWCHSRNAIRSFALSHIVLTPEEATGHIGIHRMILDDDNYTMHIEGVKDENQGDT